MVQFSIKLPESLAVEVDDLVAASGSNRTAYVVGLLREAVRLGRVLRSIEHIFEDTAVPYTAKVKSRGDHANDEAGQKQGKPRADQ